MAYAGPGREPSTRIVSPLGLVVKGRLWYLVANTDGGMRTYRVDRVRGVTPTDDPVDRPEGFDLAEHWKTVVADVDERRAPLRVRVRVRPHAVGWLRATAGTRMTLGDETPDGWIEAELRMYTPQGAAAELAGFGESLEIVEPVEIRTHLARIGEELVRSHAGAEKDRSQR
jgi:predicted DNA-binding transcriptional regulator YafY